MTFTLEQLQQLPELQGMTSLDDLSNYQDVLSGYRSLNLGDNTGGIYDALARNSYDFGDQRLIKSDVADYYNRLNTAAAKAGALNLGVNLNFADPVSNQLFDFDPNKWQIPVARFGETAGAQDMRFVPYELATELGSLNGGVYGINDFFGNRSIFEKGQLALLPDEYASKITPSDWAGTQYKWENPNLGFIMPTASLAELYAGYGNQGAPDLVGRAISSRDISGNLGTSGGVFDFGRNAALTDFAGHGMQQITPELRALLEDRALGHYEYGNFIDPRASEEYMQDVPGYAQTASIARQAFNDADWFIRNPNNPFDMLLVDAERPDWFYRPLMQTNSSMAETAQQAADWNQSNQSGGLFSDLLSDIGPLFAAGVLGVMGSGLLDSFGGVSDLFGIDAGTASNAMGSGIDSAGWGSGALDSAGLGAAELGGALAGSESAALGSLGSGLSGVELAGAGLYGQTPLTMGTLGSGLAGTTAGSLGLDAAMLGGLGAGAVGADALTSLPASLETAGSTLNSTGLPYGQTMANAPSSLDTIINNAISTGSQGYPYVDPLSTGSITGVSGLPSSGALESLGGLGLDASVGSGLEAAVSGTANESMSLWDRLLSNPSSLLNAASSASNLAGGGSRLLESLGVPSNLAGGALGLLSWLALRDQRANQASNNANARANQYSTAYTAGLSPTAWAGPTARNVMGSTPSVPRQAVSPTWNKPVRRAEGGLSRMLESNNAMGAIGYVEGGTTGQADEVPALLSDGEYVLDADIVSALGDGNNAAGAAVLDQMREEIRRHKRSAPPSKIPPPAKTPQQYLQGAM